MKYIIDLIEDVREQIGNQEDFILTAMLLKENPEDSETLIFKIDGSHSRITIGDLIPHLLILDMDAMMYALRMDVNVQYSDVEVIGFGKSIEEKKYILFIKI